MEIGSYRSEKVAKHITRIVDSFGVACYLIEGTNKACLIDTCNGVGDLGAFVKSITNLPLTVILSHGHADHIGGAGFFSHVYMNYADIPVLRVHKERAFRKDTIKMVHSIELEEDTFNEVNEGRIIDISSDTILELGGVAVDLLSVPGHTLGSMCALVEEDRTLIVGDTCDDNILLFDSASLCVSSYMKSLEKISRRGSSFDFVIGNHGSFEFDKSIIDNALECCNLILSHADAHIPTTMLSQEMFSCCPIDESGLRIDGKQGNIMYRDEKAR